MAHWIMPPALGFPRGGGGTTATLAGSSVALVPPGWLLSATRFRRRPRQVPRRAALEAAARPAARRAGAHRLAFAGGRRRLLDHVATCRRWSSSTVAERAH